MSVEHLMVRFLQAEDGIRDIGVTGVQTCALPISSLVDLIARAYGVQARQITGGPEWMSHDRYDIKAKTDIEGVPNPAQVHLLVRKLLADRFKLTLHKDKKEMSAYALTVAKTGSKTGSKLVHTEFNGPGMSFGFVPKSTGVTLLMRNGT